MTLKEKISQIIKYAKTHKNIQQQFNDRGYTGLSTNGNGFFATNLWTVVPEFDYEKLTSLTKLCYTNKIVTEVYLKNTHNITNFTQAFYYCSKLQRIETLDVTSATKFSSAFNQCSELRHIRISGVLSADFDIKQSPNLDLDSAKNIILHLKDFTGSEEANTHAIYFHENVWVLLDADGLTSPNGNSWRDYVYDLCWNT